LQYQRSGQLPQAEQIYRQILQSDPANAEAWGHLGGVYLVQGRFGEAVTAFQQVIQRRPPCAEMCNDLGIALAQQERPAEAVASFQQALQLKPVYPEAHNNLGIVLMQQGRLDEAIAHYREALRLKPDYAEAHNNLGLVLARQGNLGDAVAKYSEALQRRPDYAEAHNNVGQALTNQGDLSAAVASYQQALRFKPDYAEAHYNLGLVVGQQQKLKESITHYSEALRLRPDYVEAHWNRGLMWLALGNFEQGWPEYEWRWRLPEFTRPPFCQPLWDGTPLQGRTILLHAEQGFGDTLQFIRYAPLVKQRGGQVLVLCQPPLFRLLAGCSGIDQLTAQGGVLPYFDVQAPLLSLPGIFGTTLATIPAQVPYLSADTLLVEQWRRELEPLSGFKIGIAWQGRPTHKGDRQRSLPLAQFEPLARLPGVRLVSLQVGPGADQVRDLGGRFPLIDLGSRFDPASFLDAAAVVTTLDLVITVDSAIAHLAGALGVPVWVLLPVAPDWRWLLERADSPWYATMRLFRQTEPGNWEPVFQRVIREIQRRWAPSTMSVPNQPPPTDRHPPSEPADAASQLGGVYLVQGRFGEAVTAFQRAVQLRPQVAELYNDLGVAYAQQGCAAEAAASFQQAIQLKPAYAEAHNNLGIVYMQQGRQAEALGHYQQALRLKPDYAEAYNNLGLVLAQQGYLNEAVRHYQQALQLKPDYADAYNNLNLALRRQSQVGPVGASPPPPSPQHSEEAVAYNRQGIQQAMQGSLAEAVASFEQALRRKPDFVDAHNNLGNMFYYQGRYDAAVTCYEQAIRLQPDFAGAYNNLGNVLYFLERYDEAAANCRKALSLKPDYAEAYNNLGMALKGQGNLEEAIASCQQALRLRPDYAEAHNNLGLALAEREDWDGAVAHYQEALRLRPNFVEAHHNRAQALLSQGQVEAAVAGFQQALRLKPNYVEAYFSLGTLFLEQGRLEEAIAMYHKALELKPDSAKALNNLGVARADQGKFTDALGCYQRALRLDPSYADAHWNQALALLTLGNLEQGWPGYDWRWKRKGFTPPVFRQPSWDGSPLEGRRILLHVEQGLGDTLQFIRYAPLVRDRGGKVLVLCPASLLQLLASCPGIAELVAQGSALPDFDVQASLPSLPGIFRTTLATIPGQVPYLSADAVLVEQWRRELDTLSGLKIGIAWQGSPKHPKDRQRSVPLSRFEPLARLPGAQLVSLQVGAGADQVRDLGGRFPLIDLGSCFDPASFLDAAAVVTTLDLVITVDSAIAHLAGALGVPVWVLLPAPPDWRWLLERADSPWYPTMRLFRQTEPGDWDGVFDRLVNALTKWVTEKT
jgi:tetratricopeptide (TPR) repeat protein